MSEVKTQPVTARAVADFEEFRSAMIAGSIYVGEPDSDRSQAFWYFCPCGCGRYAPLTVGNGFKPDGKPTWNWNGSLDKPTLHPSVHHVGHWHGWLIDGVWRSV